MSAYWKETARKILEEYRSHPDDWRDQPTIRKHLCPRQAESQALFHRQLMLCFLGLPSGVVELGAGCCATARSVWLAGPGEHRIADLPEMLEMQQDILKRISGRNLPLFRFIEPRPEAMEPFGEDCLFISTFALSEMDLPDRGELEPTIQKFKSILISWTTTFRGIDNDAYFNALRSRLLETHHVDMIIRSEHRHRYLLARRK